RDAERPHRLAYDIFTQHWTERRPAIAPARERGRPRALELDIAAHTVGVDDLAEQDGAAVTELRHEMTELMAGIGHRDRIGAFREPFAGKDFSSLGGREQVRIK